MPCCCRVILSRKDLGTDQFVAIGPVKGDDMCKQSAKLLSMSSKAVLALGPAGREAQRNDQDSIFTYGSAYLTDCRCSANCLRV